MSVKERLAAAITKCFPRTPSYNMTYTTTTTTATTNAQVNTITYNWPANAGLTWDSTGAIGMIQPLTIQSSPYLTQGIDWREPAPTFTDEQMAKLEERLVYILSNGWTCPKCQAVWAPCIEFCRVCSLVERVEHEQV